MQQNLPNMLKNAEATKNQGQNKEATNSTKEKEPHTGKRSYSFATGLTVRLSKSGGACHSLSRRLLKCSISRYSNFCKRFKRFASSFLSDQVSCQLEKFTVNGFLYDVRLSWFLTLLRGNFIKSVLLHF